MHRKKPRVNGLVKLCCLETGVGTIGWWHHYGDELNKRVAKISGIIDRSMVGQHAQWLPLRANDVTAFGICGA